MRNSYMTEYQTNLDMNTSRKEDRITEVTGEIDVQNSLIETQQSQKDDFSEQL